MKKNVISMLLVSAMLLTSVNLPVFADTIFSNSSHEFAEIPKAEDDTAFGDDVTLFADNDLSTKLLTEDCIIDESGEYTLTGSSETTFGHSIIVKAGVNAVLNITDVTISSAAAPIKVESGATLTLKAEGVNTLTATAQYHAGIAVYANDATSNYGTLIIEGNGTLNANGALHGAGIGNNRINTDGSTGINGRIVINSGIINAKGGTGGAGIGSSFNLNGAQYIPGDIVINGGVITATGGINAAGIGGANSISNGLITINGGYVEASSATATVSGIGPGRSGSQSNAKAVVINGGNIKSSISPACEVKNKDGASLTKVTLTIPDGANKDVTVDLWPDPKKAKTDSEGKVYTYVSEDLLSKSFALECDGAIYYTLNLQENTTLEKYTGDPCKCTQGNSSVTLDVPDTITVNKIAQRNRVSITTRFNPANDCTYPIHSVETTVEPPTKDGLPVDESIAKLSDDKSYLIAYYNESEPENTIRLTVSASMNGITHRAYKDITIKGDNSSRFNLSDGGIIISKGTQSSTIRIQHGTMIYNNIPDDTVIYLYMNNGAQATQNTITIDDDVTARLAIENINILTEIAGSKPLTIGNNAKLTLELSGSNKMQARRTCAISGYRDTAELIIEENSRGGSLEAISGLGAGIGEVKKVTVNSGTIKATGGNGGISGNGGAGIGGDKDGAGIEVVVNDGYIEAIGSGNAAGVGGGEVNGQGGKFTINGGTVIASSGGVGIGGSKSTGEITINGGSVKGSLAVTSPTVNGSRVYRVVTDMEGITEKTKVTYTIGDDDSNPIPATTDDEGKLYLYLHGGEQWIRVYVGEGENKTTYYRNMRIATRGENTAHCVADPKAKINSFIIAGQIGETVINDEEDNPNPTIEIKVPYNIRLSAIAPIVQFKGSEATPSVLNFNNAERTAAYTVKSDDKKNRVYTVHLTVADPPAEDQADVFDVSLGNILIYESYVRYGNTTYEPNTNGKGYIITGTSETNRVTLDSANKLPPIELNNLTLDSKTDAVPLTVNISDDITVSGVCTIKSSNTNAIEIKKPYADSADPNITITGKDENSRLIVQGIGANPAITLGEKTTLSITGLTTSILADDGVNAIEKYANNAGKFVTDSDSIMRITSSETPAIQPEDAEGRPLYQLTAHINARDKSITTCTDSDKDNKTYYVGENEATLYFMKPNGEYNMNMVYNEALYSGTAAIEDNPAEVTLYTLMVEGIKYNGSNTPPTLPYGGGTVVFTLEGTMLSGGSVKVRLEPTNNESVEPLEAVVGNDSTATIVIPPNNDSNKALTYAVYTVIGGDKTRWANITVSRNDTICFIKEFEIENQLEDTTTITEGDGTVDNIITVYMPYDHEFKTSYTVTKVVTEPENLTVRPLSAFSLASNTSNPYMRGRYEVMSRDGSKTREYQIRVRKNAISPSITTLGFNNPTTSEESTIRVTARGVATNTIQQAEKPENKKVYILLYDGETEVACEEATQVMENGIAVFTANITVPENDSDDNDAEYTLKVKIGSVEQTNITSNTTVTVPRKHKSISGIKNMSVTGGKTQISGTNVTITMPYDADITALAVNEIEYEEENAHASCSPAIGEVVDFTNPVKYTVTAENGVDKTEYMVTVVKEETPVAKSIEFKNPDYSSAGGVDVVIKGDHLANAENAVSKPPTIMVGGKLTSGDNTNTRIVSVRARKVDNSEDYIATIIVPQNDSDVERVYELFVEIGGTRQTLTGETTLTVPAKEDNIAVITDVIITEGQQTVVNGNKIYVYVPYNTNIKNVVPQIHWNGRPDNGISPAETEAQDFTQPVNYTVYAADGTSNTYEVNVLRDGIASISEVTFDQPSRFDDTEIEIDITGQFVPDNNDTIAVSAVPRGGGDAVVGEIIYDPDVYGGHATVKLKLNENTSSSDQIYDVKILLNGEEQLFSFPYTITVPKYVVSGIKEFRVNGQVGLTEFVKTGENTENIIFKVPYNTDLTSIAPVIQIEGDSISPASGTAQDFDKKTVTYTVFSRGEEPKVYNVTAQRDGLPSISSVELTNLPTMYKGTKVNAVVKGVFFYDMKIKAVPIDENGNDINGAEAIDGTVTMNKHEASAKIDIPDNNTAADKRYRLDIYLDNFSNSISYADTKIITVPRQKTRAITQFKVDGQIGDELIGERDIIVKVQYDADLSQIRPIIAIDGDSVSPASGQTVSFDNETRSRKYTVSAAGHADREYTVYIQRDGDPTISKVETNKISNYKGGPLNVLVEGTFFESLKVTAVPNDGGERITGTITSGSEGFAEGSASIVLNIPENNDFTDKVYSLEFELDGKTAPYTGDRTVTVPRRTRRNITSFIMPGIAEGTITGNTITIEVPYNFDISAIKPEIEFDADSISPSLDEAQDFSDDDNKITYTLSSEADDDVTYTVNVIRTGEAPTISSITVDGQVEETVYDGRKITITLPANADLTSVTPVITVSDGADYEPKGPQDFTTSADTPIIYTVTDQNGVKTQYEVSIKNKEKEVIKQEESSSSKAKKPTATPIPEKTPTPVTETPEPTQTPDNTPKTMPYIRGYEEFGLKLFKPENTITRAEVAAIMSLIDADFDENAQYPNIFGDVADDAWYSNYMNYASEKGYIQGYDDGTSRPENNITRAEFVSIIARYMDVELYTGMSLFKDIDNVVWCRNQINTLAQLGIVNGYDDAMFKPDKFISRAETVAIVNRVLEREMTDEIREKLNNPFYDITSDHWAYDNVLLASCEY